jgi:ribosomal-protein-alanine acetyltransferase
MIRPATPDDVEALVRIEQRCFDTDQLTRRSFRYLLTRAHAFTLVEAEGAVLRGYATVLLSRGTSLARLYSFAVDPDARGTGTGRALLRAAEDAAREHGCVSMRLEVRPDNRAAIALYEAEGYRRFGTLEDYYEDHAEALRYEKTLVAPLDPAQAPVPYYRQTLDFTCGPAALMMAYKALMPSAVLSRTLELRLWRESTTVFMTSGLGGCGPYGLALAAHGLGLDVEVWATTDALFVDSVRSAEKKEVIALVQADFLAQLRALPVPVHRRAPTVDELEGHFEAGGIPIVLISSYRIYREKFPHWVVVTGYDSRYVYVHDPYVDTGAGKHELDCISMPIAKADFRRMARYGRAGQRAAVVVRARRAVRLRRRTGEARIAA